MIRFIAKIGKQSKIIWAYSWDDARKQATYWAKSLGLSIAQLDIEEA